MRISRRLVAGAAFGAMAVVYGSAGLAAEVTLRAVGAWPEKNAFSVNYEKFIEKVNAEGKGIVQIRYLGGGAKVMPPFEVGNAVKAGIVDMATSPATSTPACCPSPMRCRCPRSPSRSSARPAPMDYVNRVWGEKMNVFYLGKSLDQVPYHIFFKKPVTKADLTGMRVRGIPIYKAFIESLGGATVTLPPGELYTALERGVVEAYGWPAIGIFDLSLQEQTKARIDPGFYNVEIGVLVNLNTWKKLDNKQREFLQKQAIWMEALNLENKKMIAEEVKRQSAAGIQTVELKGAERDAYLKKAYDSVWSSILQRSPQHGPKLKELLYK